MSWQADHGAAADGTDRTEGLAGSRLLAGLDLPPRAVAALADACEWVDLPAERTVVDTGDTSDTVFFLVSGRVRVFFQVQQNQEVSFAELGPGDVFGEIAAIDGRGRSAAVVTVEPTRLAICPRAAFIDLLLGNPAVALRLVEKFAAMVRAADQRLTRFAAMTGVQRVYLELLRISAPDVAGDGTWTVDPAPLHRDIASWAGTTTDVVGRAFGHLMRAGLLRRRGGSLHIIDRDGVERLAAQPAEAD